MRRTLLLLILPLLLAADAPLRRLDPDIPQPVYWFWWPETYLENDYLDQARRLVDGGPFTHLVYSRRPVMRPDAPDLVRALKAVADLGRPAGVGLVIQQWAWPLPHDRLIKAVSHHHWTLDRAGACQGTVPGGGRVLAAVLAHQGVEGALDLKSAQAVPAQAIMVDSGARQSRLRVSAGASQAGRELVVLWAQPARPDVLDRDAAARTTRDLSTRFGGVGAAGLVTDELRTLDSVGLPYYSPALEALYLDHFGRDLTADLLQGLAGTGGERIAARGRLLWTRRQLAAAFEGIVARASREVCGSGAFTGLHPTYFNFRPGDRHVAREFDRNALSFWDLDRTYSQTDEEHPLPMRLGQARHCPGPVWFNMVYGQREVFERQIVEALPAGGRIHYHAAADRGEWGENVDTLDFLAMARRVEGRIRILNAVQRALPAADLLILWGYPGSVGWIPDRDPGAVTYEATFRLSESLWLRGFRCDVVPTYEIDDGELSVGADGRIHYHNATYEAVLWTSPAYAEKATLALLEQYTDTGGRLFVAGTCRTDADGQDARERFGALVKRSAAAWDHIPPADEAVETLMRLGVPRRRRDGQGEMLDGLVIAVDRESLFWDADWRGEVSTGGPLVTFDARGLFAVKLDREGRLERLAAGGLRSASAAGRTLLVLDGRADVALWRRVPRPASSGRAHDGVPKTPAGQGPGGPHRHDRSALLIRSDTSLVPPVTRCDLPGIPAVEARTEVSGWPLPTVVVTVTNRGPADLETLLVTCRPLTQWRMTAGDRPPDRLAAGETARAAFHLTPVEPDGPAQGSRVVPIVLARAGMVDLQLEPEVYLAPTVEIEVPTQRRPVILDAATPADCSITIRNPDRTSIRAGTVRLAVTVPGWRVEPASRDVQLAAEETWTGSFRLTPTPRTGRAVGNGVSRLVRSEKTSSGRADLERPKIPAGQDRPGHPGALEAETGEPGTLARLVATFTPAEGGRTVTGRSGLFHIIHSPADTTGAPTAPPTAPDAGRGWPGPGRAGIAVLLGALLTALVGLFVWLRRRKSGDRMPGKSDQEEIGKWQP